MTGLVGAFSSFFLLFFTGPCLAPLIHSSVSQTIKTKQRKETNLVTHVTKKAGWSFNLIYLYFYLVNPSQQALSPSQVCTRCSSGGGPLGMTAINPKITSAEFDPNGVFAEHMHRIFWVSKFTAVNRVKG